MQSAVLVSTFALMVAACFATACSSSAPQALGGVCSELYGQGLTGCTEHCRPFGVLDFGVVARADGSIGWTCECMPGPASDEERPTPKEGFPDGETPHPFGYPGRHVDVAALDRTPDTASDRPPTSG